MTAYSWVGFYFSSQALYMLTAFKHKRSFLRLGLFSVFNTGMAFFYSKMIDLTDCKKELILINIKNEVSFYDEL
jgi:hypothetical protein